MISRVLRLVALLVLGAGLIRGAERTGPEVLVAADAIATPEGFRPAPGKPVYYLLHLTPLALGEAVAGEKVPKLPIVERAVVAELAKQGFVRAEVGGPMPSIFILATWGAANFKQPPDDDLEFFQQFVPARQEGDPNAAARIREMLSARDKDRGKIAAITGLNKVAVTETGDGRKVLEAANEDRMFLTLSALDAQRFAKKERVLLWRTSMSIDWRLGFEATLPAMLASAGPYFGTDVATPAFVDDRMRRDFEVHVGEARVVPDDTPASPPVEKK